MPAEPSAGSALALLQQRFRSAAEALQRQDYFQGPPADPGGPALLIWQSPRALLAAPGDSRLPGFEETARSCAEHGWPVVLRRPGGRVCPIGPGTLQLAISRPVAEGVTIETAYDEMARLIEALLGQYGLEARRGLCPDAFCPGRYDIAVDGRKIAGLAQAWRRHRGEMMAITGASLILDETPDELAEAVNLFYALTPEAPPCRAEAIGSVSGLAGRQVTADEATRALTALLSEDA